MDVVPVSRRASALMDAIDEGPEQDEATALVLAMCGIHPKVSRPIDPVPGVDVEEEYPLVLAKKSKLSA